MPRYFDWFRPVPGIIELLEELRAQDIRMAVISNWPPSLPGVLEHHCLKRFFDPIVYSGEDGIAKPDQRIFERALRTLGIEARHAIYIGDSMPHDIEPAQRIGMQTIHFNPRRNCNRWDADDVTALRRLLTTLLHRERK
jgi:putative hydrolase of the HAD superfamily